MGPETPVIDLLNACTAQAEASAWEEFIRRFHPVIAGTVTKTSRNWGQAPPTLVEELSQDVYLRLCANDYRILRGFVPEHPDSIYGFLKAIAFSVTHDHFRGLYAEKRGSGRPEVELTERVAVAQSMSDVERRILIDEIESALTELANPENRERDRLIFLLHYRDGLTSKAIAALPSVGLAQKGVEAIIQRLVGRIKRHFATRAGGE